MNNARAFAVLISLLLAIPLVSATSTLAETEVRELSSYDKAGPIALRATDSPRVVGKATAMVRKFLWAHWRQRMLGMLVVRTEATEGGTGKICYFIEPDTDGIWHIAVELETEDFDPLAEKSEHRSERYRAYTITRIEVPGDGMSARINIPDKENRSPKSYRLVLKDRKGEVLGEL